MGKAVMRLLPDMGGEQVVQRGDFPPPGQFGGDFQPLGVLVEHRIDDVDKGLVAIEQPMPSGEQIAFEPTFTLMLAEHFHDPSVGGKKLIIRFRPGFPLAVGDLKNSIQAVGKRLVGTKNPEIALLLIKVDHLAQEFSQNMGVGGLGGSGRGHIHRKISKIGHNQVAQQQPAIGVRISAHPPVAFRCKLGQFGQETALFDRRVLRVDSFSSSFQVA